MQPLAEGVQDVRIIAYTQDAQGRWKREALPTKGYDDTDEWGGPGMKLVSFSATITKPGFYALGYP